MKKSKGKLIYRWVGTGKVIYNPMIILTLKCYYAGLIGDYYLTHINDSSSVLKSRMKMAVNRK